MSTTFTISEVAKKNGLSAKTIQNVIRENPQLGIVMKPRVKTILTYEQAAQISGLVSGKKTQFSENEQKTEDILSISQISENSEMVENSQFSITAKENSELEELRKMVLELTERAAKAEGKAEMLQSQVDDLKSQRSEWSDERARLQSDVASVRGLLESSEAKAARAEAQVDLARSEVAAVANAGFFSRGRMAKELYEKLTRLELESGE